MRVNANISIDERLLTERFVAATGPGGQNVNKLATAVELRFDVGNCPALNADVCARLATLAGRRLTDSGILIIRAERFRTQERNRADARERLRDLISRAAIRPRTRVPTRPSRASKERRLKAKTHRSTTKRMRSSKPDMD